MLRAIYFPISAIEKIFEFFVDHGDVSTEHFVFSLNRSNSKFPMYGVRGFYEVARRISSCIHC